MTAAITVDGPGQDLRRARARGRRTRGAGRPGPAADPRRARRSPEVSFTIEPGEIVGFLGPNGAGKTTTLKMLAGLLHPTTGTADVLGFTPWRRDRDYLGRMSLIMGQRNQLHWDIPVLDSYRLNQAIFRIPAEDFRTRLDELVELLDLEDLLRKPVRNLSLGERMKCEIAGSLLHAPAVLFLDEPTIGLDVAMQRRIRSFIAEYNARTGACVMLTSHYMADVEALCRRVIVIHQGRLLYDGDLTGLVAALRRAQDDHRRAGGGCAGAASRCRPGWSTARRWSGPRPASRSACPRPRPRPWPAGCWPRCRWRT